MDELVPFGQRGVSPFDAIRRTRPDGSEYWSARDLMPLLGYDRWERFADAIRRAQAAAEVQGRDAGDLFRGAAKKSSGGRPAEDFELARFACYLVAMNGDPRKPEVAAAQAYFAIRTRQAEIIEQAVMSVEDRSIKRLAVLQAAKGLVDPKHLEAKARCQIAIGLGETPEITTADRPLYAQTYLEEKGLSRKQIKSISGIFGKRLKAAYIEQFGVEPKQYPLEAANGQIRNANAYTEADRPLMDAVWNRYYAEGPA
ncbi:hypothetical protein [Mycobacterium botniense]|uniref:DNA damage-inducible protein D n=1 Tax=Mycobacterium botniense TaxID=84962 RepID=A0A7I9XS04_9MYCO|nr:hypothetical protein [Mycobacterium botniense]GFG72724.1 hypothetical protein MBOT_00890 [Mycobacterium botniense]